jgi:hypothetical protein
MLFANPAVVLPMLVAGHGSKGCFVPLTAAWLLFFEAVYSLENKLPISSVLQVLSCFLESLLNTHFVGNRQESFHFTTFKHLAQVVADSLESMHVFVWPAFNPLV